MQKKLLIATSLLAIGTLTPTWACNASHVLGAGGAGAVYTISANTMEKDTYYMGLTLESVQNNSLTDTTMINAMKKGARHLHGIDAVNSYALAFSYGITDDITINMQVPYTSRTNIRAGEVDGSIYEVISLGDAEGLGDTSAIVQYKVYDEVVKIALLAGIKVPTGKTDVQALGEVLEADLQPGSGSLDFFAGAALTKDYESISLHSNILYKYNTKGVGDSQLGDILTYNLALSYKLLEHKHDYKLRKLEEEEEFGYSVNIFGELNGERAEKDRFSGSEAQNTGHNVIFATAGMQAVSENGYSLFLTLSIPVYQNFNGVQNEISYKSSLGMGKSF